jgi:hypothetical protein
MEVCLQKPALTYLIGWTPDERGSRSRIEILILQGQGSPLARPPVRLQHQKVGLRSLVNRNPSRLKVKRSVGEREAL